MEETIAQNAAQFWSYLPAIITAVGTIVMGWFGYNQYTKNKMTDQKIESWKASEERKADKRSEDLAKIFGELWNILRASQADRVYIIQPHPLVNNEYISISLEVRDNGISSMKPVVHRMSMESLPKFCSDLATVDYMLIRDVRSEVKDQHMRSIFATNGTNSAVIKRIATTEQGWIGSLVIDFCHDTKVMPEVFEFLMNEAVDSIRYILPEYK